MVRHPDKPSHHFEALAVNAGSLLTPIGNPQNILLWGRSGLSFPAFIGQMLPLAAAMMLTLLALCWFCFPAKRLDYQSSDRAPSWRPKLVWSCLAFYGVFLTALELKQELWGLALIALGFCCWRGRSLSTSTGRCCWSSWRCLLTFTC